MHFITLSVEASLLKELHESIPIKYAMISILSPDYPDICHPVSNKHVDTLYLRFTDFDYSELDKNIPVKYPMAITFSRHEATKILNFMKKMQTEVRVVLIHCEMGLSRSAGVADALSKIYNSAINPEKYIHCFSVDEFTPNKLVSDQIIETASAVSRD